MNDLVVKKNNEVDLWDNEKWLRVIEIFVPKGVSKQDTQIFLELAKSYQLNPFKKEIWIIPYGNKANIFTSRDGYLTIAHRTGNFNGMNTTFQYNEKGNLISAECTAHNKSMDHPIICKVFLDEYTTNQNLWKTKPHVMLQKVAESTALRRAFNINGLSLPEEFGDGLAIIEPPEPQRQSKTKPKEEPKPKQEDEPQKEWDGIVSEKQLKRLFAISKKSKWSSQMVKNFMKSEFNIESTKKLDFDQYELVCSFISDNPVDAE